MNGLGTSFLPEAEVVRDTFLAKTFYFLLIDRSSGISEDERLISDLALEQVMEVSGLLLLTVGAFLIKCDERFEDVEDVGSLVEELTEES